MALDLHKASRRTPRYSLTPVEITRDIVNSKFYKDPLQLLGEKSFGSPTEVPEDEVGTPMQEFYRGKTVFITGGTGFMGKTLMEKLLRSCPHIKHIYLLVRPKRGKDIQERVEAVFKDRMFWRLRTEVPSYRSKVSAVAGDCAHPGLGLNEADRQLLVQTVQVMFHGAATVRFDEHIKIAVQINVCGVQAMVELAKEMKQLKAFVHVSTAFTHCPRQRIDEQFYPAPVSYENLIQMINEKDDAELTELTPKLLHEWPNTYTFTKALAEDVITKEANGLPVAVFRPAVIISTYREPVRGWIDNVYGPVGMMVGIGSGVLHTHLLDLDNVVDMVPVDLVVNAIAVLAWDIASNKTESTDGKDSASTDSKDEAPDIPIFNFVSSAQNPITMRDFYNMNLSNLWPPMQAIWYVSFWPTTSLPLFYLLNFFLHTVPAFFLDNLAKMTGRKPMLSQIYKKIAAASETLHYFAIRRWTWTDNNVKRLFQKLDEEDQELFFFDMGQMSWEYHLEAMALGLRVYLAEDDVTTLPAARRKWQRLYIAHCILQIVAVCVLIFLFLYIIAIVSGV